MKMADISKSFFAVLLAFAFCVQPVFAQEDGEIAAEEETMTQGQLAIILARSLGLVIGTPLSASPVTAILALEQVGISPAGGWSPDAPVTLGNMASIINRLQGNEVPAGTADVEAAEVEVAVASGVDFSSIASALASAGVISEGARASMSPPAQTFNDPLARLPPGRPVDSFDQLLNDTVPFEPPSLPALTPN